jgi:hypothetical protein
VPDYYVAAIAVSAAERFVNDPRIAPPVPALIKNALFLRAHASDLARLHELRMNRADARSPH